MPEINWGAAQAALVQRFGDRVAVRDGGGAITYADLFAAAAGVARHLWAAGVAPGERVGTLFRNGIPAVVAAYGAQIAGAAETPLNIASSEAEVVA